MQTKRKIAVLGSTGSIGTQALQVATSTTMATPSAVAASLPMSKRTKDNTTPFAPFFGPQEQRS